MTGREVSDARRPSRSATLRVSDEAREAATRRVARAYSKGRLETAELDERTALIWSAKTREDLRAVTRDLPRSRRSRRPPMWSPFYPLWAFARMLRRRRRRRRERRR